ncbi:intermembrane lipid transfer protein VPS13B-like isoform X1 [Hemiscyllium ocellatum]|uniref:intermembrane lipid transfer protein VPS13B-like isoform X1 n=1 Tax=Hemiscyllium ocellatum TaxID=170820 RepID=UPI00296619B5|nr:intermembrane lipid transfer protein VPS13B-like isoform X1 [Hemiscyllium ocellatum]XP_060679859.1 intermembrane lipid transfer protein VPS13B-like isoform X1 [Hemiscyllium ocellatum]
MLESYVTPILMSYVNRYIKNLKPSDLQLSLWGGDAVLSKLELKLDVLEQELKLPFTFLSGHIHELRIHVPWTKLGSEPVVITINTMECILKLKDDAHDDHESCGSSSTNRSTTESIKSLAKTRRIQQVTSTDPDLPPGYVQSLIRRVVNNVNIVVNNLILKYVEDDIVLSVNITSAECYTVDEFWDRAFMDVLAPELVLRKIIHFSDCTVCLDKRNASGKIEFYQDPLLYKCSFCTRLHFTYDNLNSKIPAVIKIQALVESLKLSITDQQLPMLIRIIQLGIALYYGEICSYKDVEVEETCSTAKEASITQIGTESETGPQGQHACQYQNVDAQQQLQQQGGDDDQGWVSWAWSLVPALVSYSEEGDESYEVDENGIKINCPRSSPPKDPIISVGIYCTKATITFKLTEMQTESSYYSPQKVKSKEVLCWEQEGTTVEVLMMGELFFDCQMGFVGCKAFCLKGIMGVKDFEEPSNRSETEACFFSCGESLNSKGLTYLTNSLFDYRSPENNGVRAEFILDAAQHKETYTEIAGVQRFGAFYMDYLYTMECSSGKGSVSQQQDVSANKSEDLGSVQEMSTKSLVIGPMEVRLDSSSVHRILKMVACGLDHEYEPYSKPHSETVDEKRTMPSQEELAALEEYIPTRLTCITVLKTTITITLAEFNLLDNLLPIILGEKNSMSYVSAPHFHPLRPLPALRIQVDKGSLEHSVPMYAGQLVPAVSSLNQPSDNLLHNCYAHCYVKIFGFQAGLTSLDSERSFCPPAPVIPPFSTAFYGKLLRLPSYWLKRPFVPTTECIFELPSLTLQATRAQTLLLQTILQSWTHNTGTSVSLPVDEALLKDIFRPSGVKSQNPLPTLEGSIQNVELKYCSTSLVKCVSGTMGSIKACAKAPGRSDGMKEKLIPLIQGPSDTRELHKSKWLNESRKPESLFAPDLITFTVQIPQQMDSYHNSGAVLLACVQGIAVNVDPIFYVWLLQLPQKMNVKHRSQQSAGAVQLVMPTTRKKEDEVSVGSTPLAMQQSNQASEYASSPVKTKTATESRPFSVPIKVMQSSEEWSSPEERMKEFIGLVWDGVKRLTLQLEVQSCCVFFPNESLPSPSTIVAGDIPGTVRNWYHTEANMPGTLVICLPQIKVISAGHKYMEPLQEIPFVISRPILDEGDAFPWTISLSQFSVYTLLGQLKACNLVEPLGCTSTLAITSHKLQSSSPETRHAFVVCLHVDLESLEMKCSNPQVQLLYELAHSMNSAWDKIQKKGILRQSSTHPESVLGPMPGSPVRSSVSTAPPDASTCSPSADIGTTTEGDSVQMVDESPFADSSTLEQKTSNIGGTTGCISLWMQWMLPKVTVNLFAQEPSSKGTGICVVGELEDLSASVDIQDVYTKVKCKIGSFNIDHYRSRPGEGWHTGQFDGLLLQCKEKPGMAAKLLEGSHQQHGFLSLTYTKAVTRNVRHKLTSRPERVSRSLHRVAEGIVDSSPQYLHEILLSAQPFDVVLSFPLLHGVAKIFHAKLPKKPKAKRKSAGQPMRAYGLTSRELPLIYINTSVVRVFFPKGEESYRGGAVQMKEDTLVLKVGSVCMAPQADNPLGRTVLRKDIYQRALNLGILRDPGSEVEDRQYQIDLQSITIGTAVWDQLKPEKDIGKGHLCTESERNYQNPALEWNMSSSIRRHQERRAILTPVLTDFSVRVTAAPAILFTKQVSPENTQTEEIIVCGHSLEVNVTTSLDFFLSVAQVQLLQELVQVNMHGLELVDPTAEICQKEQNKTTPPEGTPMDASSRHSGAQDSGIGSDSARIRIVQIEQQSGTSHHRLARPSRQSSIVKNLNFIPFDMFVTASRISLMTYSTAGSSKSRSQQESQSQKVNDKLGRSTLNRKSMEIDGMSENKLGQPGIAVLTAEDLLNSNAPLSVGKVTSHLSLESLHTPSRSSARQALGVTVVRQPGRRGTHDLQVEPFVYLVIVQPSLLLSCHHRKQMVDLSFFDATLKAVPPDYKCMDPGKTLPEALDYSVFWLQTVAGDIDLKAGIPPPLISFQIKDFLNGPAEVHLELSRPWKVNLSLVKLDQATKFLKSILPRYGSEITSKAAVSPGTVYRKEEMFTSVSGAKIEPGSFAETGVDQGSIWKMVSFFQKFSIHTAQVVVAMETVPHPDKPCILASLSSVKGILNIKTGPKSTRMILGATFALQLKDLLVKTCLKDRTRALIGPFCCTLQLDAKWCRHSGDPDPHHSVPKTLVDLKAGLIQIFWGQEHLNCLNLLHELLQCYLGQDAKSQTSDHTQQPSSAVGRYQASKTEHSSDDLRTGQFQYIQDADIQKVPSVFEVVFYNETDDRPGMMMWRYPEPRVLTLVRINPVPFNTTEDPDISTADLGDVLQVPCSLQYWDELQQLFVDYREFSLSESKACELQLPNVTLANDQKELIASDLWRIVLNSNQEVTEELSSDGESGSQSVCDQLVSPMALAACTRVDSCFAPWFVPSLGISLQFAQIELHLCHHLDQLGKAHPSCLQTFIPDRKLPAEQEYMIVSLKTPNVYMRQWSDGPICRELQFSAITNCKLLEYRNLTMTSILKPLIFHGQLAISNSPMEQLIDGNVFVDPVFISAGQHAIHSLDTAVRAWRQNEHPEAEELIFSHFVMCNDTQETLRFGQVDTDENILLASQHSHQYSWRSHKSPQLLHICIEGWGNWRWSEPFSVDNIGTFVRSIQYKGRTASLIIKVQPLNSVQKQIIICGRQAICSYLNLDVELKVVQHCSGQDGQESIKEHLCCLPLNQKIPSFVLENAEFTGLCIRVMGNDTDWSPDVYLETFQSEDSTVIQIPNSNGSVLHVWCTCLNLDAKSPVQQRVLFLSPLFVMRSHLPDPIILHVERRSLGLKEPQVIAGKGQEEPLQNVEPEVVHHLTFQAREEDEASQCAVPISTVLIKQIVRGLQSDCTVGKLFREFYNKDTDARNPWPYITKKPDSKNSSELLAQWDSPMQVKLSAWKPCLNTLLVELLPWALFVNQSKWDLWLFEGEKIVVQVPAGKVIVPPNFQEPFQIGIYWASTNTVHKSTAVRLVHDVTSPKWKDYPVTDVITLDEDGIADADVKLGTFPDHQKLCQFCISSVVRHGIQILVIEDKTILMNATTHKIYYRPMLLFPEQATQKERVHIAESSVFSLSPARAHSPPVPSSIPCWDLLAGASQADFSTPLPQKYLLLGYSPHIGMNSCQFWSLPTIIRQDFPRQSVAVPLRDSGESGFCSRAVVVSYQEYLGVTYITVSEDSNPRMIIHNRCTVAIMMKENLKDAPKCAVYCRKIPAECSVHHELYHQVWSFPECKTKDHLPSIHLSMVPSPEASEEWSDVIDLNSPGTQVVFLPGYGCVYVDISHHSSTIIVTMAPEGRAGPVLTSLHGTPKQTIAMRVLITQASLTINDDVTNHCKSSELLRLTLDNVLLNLAPVVNHAKPPSREFRAEPTVGFAELYKLEVCVGDLQIDNQLYHQTSFHFPALLCQELKPERPQWRNGSHSTLSAKDLDDYKHKCFLTACILLREQNFVFTMNALDFELKPARLYVEDTFVYYIKTLFNTYIPDNGLYHKQVRTPSGSAADLAVPEQVVTATRALVNPIKLQRLTIHAISLLVSVHASIKLYIASDHAPLSFSLFERGPIYTTPRQLIHALAMHYAAGALFRAGWVVGSLEILGSPANLVRSIGNGIADFFRLPYEGLTRGPGAFVSGVSRGTTSFVKHISKGTLTSITNLATSLARNMDRLSLDEEHYNRQEEWRRQLPDNLGEGLRQGLSRLGLSLLGAIAGIVDQPMQNFQKTVEVSAGRKAKDVISGVGKGIVGVFTKPIGGAAELVSQTGYGILHGAGLSQLPKQRFHPTEQQTDQAPNSHVKYVWKMLQSLGRPEVFMALDVVIVSNSGQEYEGCLLLTSEVLFVVSVSEDTQQQAFPVTEIECRLDPKKENVLQVVLKQQRVSYDAEGDGIRERLSEQQYDRLVDYVTKTSHYIVPSSAAMQLASQVVIADPPASRSKTYQYLVDSHYGRVFVSKFSMVKNKALRKGFH